jgi:hypothetical protein
MLQHQSSRISMKLLDLPSSLVLERDIRQDSKRLLQSWRPIVSPVLQALNRTTLVQGHR